MVCIVRQIVALDIRQRRARIPGQVIRNEKSIRQCVHVEITLAQNHVLIKRANERVITHREERVVVAFEPWSGRPARKTNPALVGAVAMGHPFLIRDAELLKESPHFRRRTFADADNADRIRFE